MGKQQKYYFGYDHFRGIKGFTLIELLVGVALSSILALVLYEMLTTQDRVYSLQGDITEMQQNLRTAVEKISRDLTMTGSGKPQWSIINQAPDGDASSWYNSANGWKPYRITGSGTNYAIDIIGCIDSAPVYTNVDAAAGSTTITLQTGQGANFNTTTKQDINIGGTENAKITAVAGNTLTIDTDPATAGNQGLLNAYSTGNYVCSVKWVTYSLGTSGGIDVLRMDEHRGSGNQPIAQYITGMTISMSGNLVTLTLTGRTKKPDRTTGQYISSQATNKIMLRN